jgi:molecular chaperone HtpG
MPGEQSDIYYVLGDSMAGAARSPHLDPFKVRNLEVFLWHEPLDIFIAPMLQPFRDKKFRNVAEAEIELPPADEPAADAGSEPLIPEPDINRFIGLCVKSLGDKVSEVRVSRVLKDNPVRLVASDGHEIDMQRIYRMMGREFGIPAQILEVNRNHPLIAGLARLATHNPESPLLLLAIEQLYDSALMQEGLHPNPSDMLPRIQALMQIAADAAAQPARDEQ